ncbi:flagellar motor switch protein FliG [Hydrogenothermus marinus]|uniref:Flagellar motor switch protein FliG n=1 Tax=Hydrogenothermus marinus TaxID=133270 RepID=A0A3M0BSL5_9AQUI|nr:flagellar motor switch protein FliG [Hydrogenothermus marinus]RMA97505.1 flagellar motor switch protein FliG [Hydrogenothermus marinus]
MAEESKNGKLSGLEKAAILISLLPEEKTKNIFSHLKESEIEKIVKVIISLEHPDKETIKKIIKEALDKLKSMAPLKVAPSNIKKILEEILPPDKLEKLFGEALTAEEGKAIFRELDKLDPKLIANILQNEHPQVIALILSQLKPQKAAEIIQYLPKRLGVTNVREEVIKRLATLEKISSQMLKTVADTLEEELLSIGAGEEETLSGIDIAAEIVNSLPKDLQTEILEDLRKDDEKIAEQIEDRMFKFEDIIKLTDRDIMEVLKAVDKNDLLIALKGAPEEILNKFLNNMSKRAAQMFLEDMELLGPVKKSEVENARKKVILTIKELIEKGVIEYGSGEEMI